MQKKYTAFKIYTLKYMSSVTCNKVIIQYSKHR